MSKQPIAFWEYFFDHPDGYIEIDFELATCGFVAYLYTGNEGPEDGATYMATGDNPEDCLKALKAQLPDVS